MPDQNTRKTLNEAIAWSYIQRSSIEDEVIASISDEQLLQLAFDGKITPKTHVLHPKHTENQWVTAERIPGVLKSWQEGDSLRSKLREERNARLQARASATLKAFLGLIQRTGVHVSRLLGILYANWEPQLRRCMSGAHHQFWGFAKCRECGLRTVKMVDATRDEINKAFIEPFLRRNETATPGIVPNGAFTVMRLRSLDRATTAIVTPDELQLLEQVMGTCPWSNSMQQARKWLNAFALRSDFGYFRDRIEAME